MATLQRFDLTHDDGATAVVACVEALRAGRLVVVPTETVYGLAALPAGRAALDALKGPRRLPYSRAASGLAQVEAELEPLPGPARRAANRWWPGPVTQVLTTRDGGCLGLRIPGHAWTRQLIEAVGEPLLLPSANVAGAPAPLDTRQLSDEVLAAVAVVVDGGPTSLGEASTVLRPGPAAVTVLREGVVSRRDVAQRTLGSVLVACTGNTCRSPMAAALLERALGQLVVDDERRLVPRVVSAGVHAGPGAPAAEHAVAVMARRGLDLADQRSAPLAAEHLQGADLLLGMTGSHVAALADVAPPGVAVELFDPAGSEVPDPFGGPLEIYAACADALEAMAVARAASLFSPHEFDR